MKNVWCVRAEYGTYTNHFVKGGYVGIGYGLTSSLEKVTTREELTALYKAHIPTKLVTWLLVSKLVKSHDSYLT
jgi:restriction system protein